jgi:hypothetical protein
MSADSKARGVEYVLLQNEVFEQWFNRRSTRGSSKWMRMSSEPSR